MQVKLLITPQLNRGKRQIPSFLIKLNSFYVFAENFISVNKSIMIRAGQSSGSEKQDEIKQK
jgi:hypothetical protein